MSPTNENIDVFIRPLIEKLQKILGWSKYIRFFDGTWIMTIHIERHFDVNNI